MLPVVALLEPIPTLVAALAETRRHLRWGSPPSLRARHLRRGLADASTLGPRSLPTTRSPALEPPATLRPYRFPLRHQCAGPSAAVPVLGEAGPPCVECKGAAGGRPGRAIGARPANGASRNGPFESGI